MKKAIFLDRDGVINVEKEYLYKAEDFEFIDGVLEACKVYIEKGYIIIVITNQSGIGRGYYTQSDFEKLTIFMKNEFAKHGVEISNVYHCPHAPDVNCACRKPNIGMISNALEEFDIDLSTSWLFGDKESDIQTAINAGIAHYALIRTGHKIDESNSQAQYILNSLLDTIPLI